MRIPTVTGGATAFAGRHRRLGNSTVDWWEGRRVKRRTGEPMMDIEATLVDRGRYRAALGW